MRARAGRSDQRELSRARPQPLKAILLDALGTLLELQPPASFLRAELSERFGVSLSESDAEGAIAAEIAFYRGHFNEGRDQESLTVLRQRCAEALRGAMPEKAPLKRQRRPRGSHSRALG